LARRRRCALEQAAALALCVAAWSCRSSPHAAPPPIASTRPSSVAPRSSAPPRAGTEEAVRAIPALPPLSVREPFVDLDVPGFRAATIAVPDTPVEPRQVIVALHGNFDRPEWQCRTWRPVTHARYWIVCPRGIPRRDAPRSLDRWEWASLAQTKAEILAALAALRRSFGDYVEPTEIVLVGFSLGAILGVRLLKDADLGIASAVLIEGGYTGITREDVRAMNRLGLRGVLFACGQSSCRNALRGIRPLFEREQIFLATVEDLHAGHDYAALADLIEARFSELEEAPRRSSIQPPLPFR